MNSYEVTTEAAKAVPATTLFASILAGVTLNDAVLILSALFIVLQIILLVRKHFVDKKKNSLETEKLKEELMLARMKVARLERRDEKQDL